MKISQFLFFAATILLFSCSENAGNGTQTESNSSAKTATIETGDLLIAHPNHSAQMGPFKESVIFIFKEADIFYGVKINSVSDKSLDDIALTEGFENVPVHLGGPVQNEILTCLHKAEEFAEGSEKVMDGIYLGKDMAPMLEKFVAGELSGNDFRFFNGYAGWSEERMMNEISDGSWIVQKGGIEHVFTNEPSGLWSKLTSL